MSRRFPREVMPSSGRGRTAPSRLYLRRLLGETSVGPRLVRRAQLIPPMRIAGTTRDRRRLRREHYLDAVPVSSLFSMRPMAGSRQSSVGRDDGRAPPDQTPSVPCRPNPRLTHRESLYEYDPRLLPGMVNTFPGTRRRPDRLLRSYGRTFGPCTATHGWGVWKC